MPSEPGQIVARFDEEHIEIETELCRKLARWTQDHFAEIQACDPKLPATAFNRLADNWRPLLAIAEVAGGDWPRLALEAFNHLTTAKVRTLSTASQITPAEVKTLGITSRSIGTVSQIKTKDEDPGVKLLADIKQIFTQTAATRLFSKQLVASLRALFILDTRHPSLVTRVTETWLGRRLARFGIHSHNVQIGDQRAKGYDLGDFTEAFARFLNDNPDP